MYKRYVNLTLFFFFFVIISYAVFIILIDPLQQYRKASWYKPTFTNQRYLNPGLAKTYNYDTVIIGTSMTENFTPKLVNQYFDYKVLKLSIEGSSSYEQKKILETSLNTKKVKRVIWGLDFSSFEGAVERLRNGEGSMPFYLYDNNIFNDYKYIFNIDIAKKYLIKIFLGNVLHKNQFVEPLEKFQYWGDKFKNQKNKLYKMAINTKLKPISNEFNRTYYNDLIYNYENNLLKYIKKNKNIEFIIILSPYSFLFWAEKINNKRINEILEFKKHLVKSTKKFNNVKVYDFQDIKTIIYNFNNYKDYTHFSEEINKYILNSIQYDNYLLSTTNIEKRIKSFKLSIVNFEKNIKKYNIEGDN